MASRAIVPPASARRFRRSGFAFMSPSETHADSPGRTLVAVVATPTPLSPAAASVGRPVTDHPRHILGSAPPTAAGVTAACCEPSPHGPGPTATGIVGRRRASRGGFRAGRRWCRDRPLSCRFRLASPNTEGERVALSGNITRLGESGSFTYCDAQSSRLVRPGQQVPDSNWERQFGITLALDVTGKQPRPTGISNKGATKDEQQDREEY